MLRRHTIRAVRVALVLCVLPVCAGADSDAVIDRAAPEIEKIAFTVGVWDTTTKYRFTPDAPVLESTSVETVQWSPNRQFLISDQRGLMPAGPMNQLVITTWDPARKEYRLVVVMPDGKTTEAGMTVDGNHRSILRYSQVDDRLVRAEMTYDYSSQTEYTFREERTDKGKTWVFCEGVSRKRP